MRLFRDTDALSEQFSGGESAFGIGAQAGHKNYIMSTPRDSASHIGGSSANMPGDTARSVNYIDETFAQDYDRSLFVTWSCSFRKIQMALSIQSHRRLESVHVGSSARSYREQVLSFSCLACTREDFTRTLDASIDQISHLR